MSGNQGVTELEEMVRQLRHQLEERDEHIARILEHVIPPSAAVHFEDAHIGREDEEEVEARLAEQLPPFIDYIRYNEGMHSLSSQWAVKERYDGMSNLKKRLFHHFYLMCIESERFPVDETSNLNISWALKLSAFANLAMSIERIVPNGGCWIVSQHALRHHDTQRPILPLPNGRKNSARLVCSFNYGTKAIQGVHASHLCHNRDCARPSHIFPEPATFNDKRKECFEVGSAASCECLPKCIFVRNGRLLPCRNNPSLDRCTCDWENGDCFFEVIRELDRRDEAEQNRPQPNQGGFVDIRPRAKATDGFNRNGNPCLIFEGRNYMPSGGDGMNYVLYRNQERIDGRYVSTFLYADERAVFLVNER